MESLVSTLRAAMERHTLDTGAFDQRLSVIEDFLKWSLDSENRGGRSALALEQLAAERGRLEQLFRSLRVAKQAKETLRGYHRKLYEEASIVEHRP